MDNYDKNNWIKLFILSFGICLIFGYAIGYPVGLEYAQKQMIQLRNPTDVIASSIKSVVAEGNENAISTQIMINKGTSIPETKLLQDIYLENYEFSFICNDQSICGQDKLQVVSGETDTLNANQDTYAYLIACSDYNGKNNPKICVAIATNPERVKDDCYTACGLD